MSRIHDALKKAQQERDLGAATDVSSPPSEPIIAVPALQEELPEPAAPVATETQTRGQAIDLSSSEYLRFDDLVACCAHPRWQPDPNVNVFMDSGLTPHGAEQFRTLRSRLYQMRGDQPLRSILITSAVAAEGKTFVASNLAQSIVRQPDRRVLLIDADLRCARLHVPLGAPQAPGLTDYLRCEADEAAIVQRGQDGNLCFIAGGNEVSNPSELLSNGRLKHLLDRLGPLFDWVILDSPPCLPVADANVLAGLCEAVLLVVRAGSTPSELSQKAAQELRGRNLLGVILNGIEGGPNYGGYYYSPYGANAEQNGTRVR